MARQARTGDRVLVSRREMTGRTQNLPLVEGGRRGKDDRKYWPRRGADMNVEFFLETRLENVRTIYNKKTCVRKGWAQRVLSSL